MGWQQSIKWLSFKWIKCIPHRTRQNTGQLNNMEKRQWHNNTCQNMKTEFIICPCRRNLVTFAIFAVFEPCKRPLCLLLFLRYLWLLLTLFVFADQVVATFAIFEFCQGPLWLLFLLLVKFVILMIFVILSLRTKSFLLRDICHICSFQRALYLLSCSPFELVVLAIFAIIGLLLFVLADKIRGTFAIIFCYNISGNFFKCCLISHQ